MTIRRSQIDSSGGKSWLLISQLEHARIAGEIAEVWHADAFASPASREELIAVGYHHDDGWADWEAAPGVDSETGRPRTFTEMPLAESLMIWRVSIERCEQIGPLAAATVASHFSFLLRHADLWDQRPASLGGEAVAPDVVEAAEWLDEFDARREAWLAAWKRQDPTCHTDAAAEDALTLLQLWDRMSLWLCCSDASEPYEMETPNEPVTMVPHGSQPATGGGAGSDPASVNVTPVGLVSVKPWPLTVDSLSLSATGREVPVARYSTAAELDDALRQASAEPVELRWDLRPPELE